LKIESGKTQKPESKFYVFERGCDGVFSKQKKLQATVSQTSRNIGFVTVPNWYLSQPSASTLFLVGMTKKFCVDPARIKIKLRYISLKFVAGCSDEIHMYPPT